MKVSYKSVSALALAAGLGLGVMTSAAEAASISLSLGATNTAGPNTYSLPTGPIPIPGGPLFGLVDFSFAAGITMTDFGATFGDGISATQLPPSTAIFSGSINGTDEFFLGTAPAGYSFAAGTGGGVVPFVPLTGTFDCGVGGCSTFDLAINFDGGFGKVSDVFGLTVSLNLEPAAVIPVPAALPLLISALGGLGVMASRGGRKSA